jgi:hypothetical protein
MYHLVGMERQLFAKAIHNGMTREYMMAPVEMIYQLMKRGS